MARPEPQRRAWTLVARLASAFIPPILHESMSIRTLGWTLLTASVTAVGCGPRDQIAVYEAPKEVIPKEVVAQPAAIPAAATAADRMLAAILPDGDRAWFFKVTGPVADVDAKAKQILDFFQSVRLATGKTHPDWQVPAGWQERPGSAMRVATLVIPAGTKPLELSVTVLPWQGPEAMLSNINRWRGQMQLPPTDQASLAKETREVAVGDGTMTVVDLQGSMSGGMMPPFAGGNAMPGATPPATAPAPDAANALPPGHPPVEAPGVANSAPFQVTVPAGWQSLPATGIRKAAFLIEQDGKSATLTAIDFAASAGPMMADPVANLNRWRVEVDLPPVEGEAAKSAIETIQVDGGDAQFMAIIPDANEPAQSQAARGTLAAMVRKGDTIWFFKLLGDRELVAAQRNNFESFLKSVRFSGAGGASDGHE